MCIHREKVLVRFSRLQIEAWSEFVSGILGCKGCVWRFCRLGFGRGEASRMRILHWLCGTFHYRMLRAYGLFTLLCIHSLLSATLVAVILHFAYAGFDLRLLDHVGGLRILKVKRGWFHTDRPDQRPFISFQLDSYDCMPLNPHLTWIRAVDGEYIGLRRSLHRFVLPKYALFPSLQKSLSTLHSFI